MITQKEYELRHTASEVDNILSNAVLCTPQTINADEQAQARKNIGASAVDTKTVYDLKEGYPHLPQVQLREDGSLHAVPGTNYQLVDYIPVDGNVSYTMYGCGYALYDKQQNLLSVISEPSGKNSIREFTPSTDGFVRLNINSEDISYARFCRTDEKHLEPWDYGIQLSPFFDPRIPCDVHLYGDSNSDWTWVEDPTIFWSYRLKTLIESMKSIIYNYSFGAFADKRADSDSVILGDGGYARLTAYTNIFGLTTADVGEIKLFVDGEEQEPIVASGSKAINFDDYGLHTIELYGVSGVNELQIIATKKRRSFTNHAVFGSGTFSGLLTVPEGNVAIVMYAGNDCQTRPGYFYKAIEEFIRKCTAANVTVYTVIPAPLNVTGENNEAYKQAMCDVIAQHPTNSINVYGEMLVASLFSEEPLYSDHAHLTAQGHSILYALVASKLQLAPPLSAVLMTPTNLSAPGDDVTGTESNEQSAW